MNPRHTAHLPRPEPSARAARPSPHLASTTTPRATGSGRHRASLIPPLLLATLPLLLASLGGCARTTGTETGNPPVIARYKVSVAPDGDATVEVTGEPGAVTPGGGSVTVENTRTGDVETAPVSEDGSFSVSVPGTPEDDFTITASDQDGTASSPQTIGPNAPPDPADWQTLHACRDSDPMGTIVVEEVILEGDTMALRMGHGSCPGDVHTYGLCYETEWAESFPIQVGFRALYERTGNAGTARCRAGSVTTVRWGLAPFRAAYADAYRTDSGAAQISLANCEGSNCSVTYRWGDEALPDGPDPCEAGTPDCVLRLPPSDWNEVATDCGFTLMLPRSMAPDDPIGMGSASCLLLYSSDLCFLSGDYGDTASRPVSPQGRDESQAPVLVAGANGVLATVTIDAVMTSPHYASLHLPVAGPARSGLTLELRCVSPDARDAYLPILGSVSF